MSEKQRFILFMVLSFLVMVFTMRFMEKKRPGLDPADPSVAGVQDSRTTGSQENVLQANPEIQPQQPLPDVETSADADGPDRLDVELLELKTDVYSIQFSPLGAVPVSWDIIDKHFTPPPIENGDESGNDEAGFIPEHLIVPDLGSHSSLDLPFQVILKGLNSRFFHEFNRDEYEVEELMDGSRKTGYRFRSPQNDVGLVMVKTWLFPDPKSFMSTLEIKLENHGSSHLRFNNQNTGLGLVMGPGLGGVPNTDNMPPMVRFARVAPILKSGVGFEYAHLSEGDEPVLYAEEPLQWAGIQSMYFMGALIPQEDTGITSARMYIDREIGSTLAADKKQIAFYPSLQIFTDHFTVEKGKALTFKFDIYMGPKHGATLKTAGHDLERVLFHDSWNWFRGLCMILMSMLSWFHGLAGNWGISIILLTFTVRLLTFPFVHKGLKAQAKTQLEMQRLKPLMDKINEKHKENPKKKQEEIFRLYREHNINPLGMLKGCGWMLIQMPIFFALYKLLYQSIDLRGASWWFVQDLSQPDKLFMLPSSLPLIGEAFNILPLIVAATQMVTSKFTMQMPTDPQQAQMQKMMIYFMPVMILVFTYSFPAGLMLYWLVSNLWQVLQQLWVNKHIRKPQQQAAAAAAEKA